MSEPTIGEIHVTIDELLDRIAARHRQIGLEAIRAFVERVRAQREFADISYGKAMQDELAEMEKEGGGR